MTHRLNDRDLWSGVVFVTIGVAALVLGTDLTIGSAEEMGEGYVPRAMAFALIASGALVVLLSFRRSSQTVARPIEGVRLRPLFFLTASIVAFVAVVQPLGLAAAIASSVAIANFAGEPLRARSLVVLIAVLCLAVGAVFVWGLGLPLDMLPRSGA